MSAIWMSACELCASVVITASLQRSQWSLENYLLHPRDTSIRQSKCKYLKLSKKNHTPGRNEFTNTNVEHEDVKFQ